MTRVWSTRGPRVEAYSKVDGARYVIYSSVHILEHGTSRDYQRGSLPHWLITYVYDTIVTLGSRERE